MRYIKNILIKNQRPIIRWRRLRPTVTKDAAGRSLRKQQQYHSEQKTMANTEQLAASNPLRFLQEDCPEDVLPLVLAFVGPQTAAVLQRTNRHWNNILQQEATWKVLCKELYKVRGCTSLRI